jgi:hypothetical protein
MEKMEVRGGGESGSNDCRNSVAVSFGVTPIFASDTWSKAGSGMTKITAVANDGVASWQQDIEQSAIPLGPL